MCPSEPSVFLYMTISRNGRWPSSSISMVNCMLLCNPLRCSRNSVRFSFPCGQMTKVSSTYLYRHAGLRLACFSAFSSKSSMKKLAMTGESGEPIGTPSVCSKHWSSKQKYVDVSTSLNSAKMSSAKWWLRSESESSTGTLVNRDTTSPRVFRNVGKPQSLAGEIPKRIQTRFNTRRKFEIKNLKFCYHLEHIQKETVPLCVRLINNSDVAVWQTVIIRYNVKTKQWFQEIAW